MSKKSHRKVILRTVAIGLILGLLSVAIINLVSARLRAPLPVLKPQIINNATAIKPKTAVLTWPAFGESAIGVEGSGVLATNGVQTPVPTASVAKLITALAILKIKPLASGSQGPTITLSQQDVDYYNTYSSEDGSVALVAAGEQISEYQALQGMLLPSANNLADSLAVWAFGSLGAYSTYANQMLTNLGLTHTHIGSDASGFQPDTTSTARDLVRLGELVSDNPVLADIVSQSSATIPVAGTVNNVNWLLGTASINGLKTGNSNQAGGVFVFSAPYQVPAGPKVTIIGAVMHGPTLQQAMDSSVPLLVSGQKALSYMTTLADGQAVGQYALPWGGSVTAVTTQAVQSLAWEGRPLGEPVITLNDMRGPQSSHTTVGIIKVNSNGAVVSNSSIKLARPITKPSIWWRLFHN